MRCDISQRLGLSFDAATYFGALRTRAAGRILLAAEEVASTQTIIQENTAAVPDGTLCTAARQVSGRGVSSDGSRCSGCSGRTSESGSCACLQAGAATRGCRRRAALCSPCACCSRWRVRQLAVACGCQHLLAGLSLSYAGTSVPYIQYLVSMAVVQAVQAQAQERLQVSSPGCSQLLLGSQLSTSSTAGQDAGRADQVAKRRVWGRPQAGRRADALLLQEQGVQAHHRLRHQRLQPSAVHLHRRHAAPAVSPGPACCQGGALTLRQALFCKVLLVFSPQRRSGGAAPGRCCWLRS